MSEVIPDIPALGIRPQFPRVKSYVKSLPQDSVERANDPLSRLQRYAEAGAGFTYSYGPGLGENQYSFSTAASDAGYAAHPLRWDAVRAALEQESGWQAQWQRSTAYAYWSLRMKARTQQTILEDFESGRRRQYLGCLSLQRTAAVIADCLALGWQDWAIDLSQRALWWLGHGGFSDGSDWHHRRTQLFVLRLIGDWQGWEERKGPSFAFDEPLFNALIAHWRTADLDKLVPLLIAACDRHTQQARGGVNAQWDISDDVDAYDPYEVLALLKLREMHGLVNPGVDHLLMRTPLGRLPDAAPPYTDACLAGVIAAARKEYPDF